MNAPNYCHRCKNSGVVFDDNQSAIECNCEWGQMSEADYYAALEDFETRQAFANDRAVGERTAEV